MSISPCTYHATERRHTIPYCTFHILFTRSLSFLHNTHTHAHYTHDRKMLAPSSKPRLSPGILDFWIRPRNAQPRDGERRLRTREPKKRAQLGQRGSRARSFFLSDSIISFFILSLFSCTDAVTVGVDTASERIYNPFRRVARGRYTFATIKAARRIISFDDRCEYVCVLEISSSGFRCGDYYTRGMRVSGGSREIFSLL